MEKKPYHHLPDGTFRNPKGSPTSRASSGKFSYRDFNQEKKKLDMTVPKDHVINKQEVLNNLEKFKNGIVGPASNALLIISFLSNSFFEKNSIILFFKIGVLRKSGRLAKLTMIFPAKLSSDIDLI